MLDIFCILYGVEDISVTSFIYKVYRLVKRRVVLDHEEDLRFDIA